jgi:pantoate--beta-alanine ligase
MRVVHTVGELRSWRASAGGSVVLAPTMGALHAGHFHLVREAARLAGGGGSVAVSIFVNPLQFGPGEDYGRYPRTLEEDVAGCAAAGATMVFAPAVEEVYHADRSVRVVEEGLSGVLCGRSRPGHFDGVCTVVTKLFNLVRPDVAVFGKKDYQQLAVIRRLARDLNMPVEVLGVETVREADGLAMSSRNRYLSAAERAQAPELRKALLAAAEAVLSGKDGAAARSLVEEWLREKAPLGRVDYVELVDAETLGPPDPAAGGALLLAAAVWFGTARLIDNVEIDSERKSENLRARVF